MQTISEIMEYAGFTEYPGGMNKISFSDSDISEWFNSLAIQDALDYYGLSNSKDFLDLFNSEFVVIKNDKALRAAAYILNKFLFRPNNFKKATLKRSKTDMLPVFVLLSGCEFHRQNMTARGFGAEQEESHKKAIYDYCTAGIRKHSLMGMDIAELRRAVVFSNAHIIQIGNLSYELKKYNYKLDAFEDTADLVIAIHIEKGGMLDIAGLEKSFHDGIPAIKKYFPEIGDNIQIYGDSWFLGKELGPYLPENGIISKIRDQFEFIRPASGSGIMKFLFNNMDDEPDFQSLPENSSLRRKIKQALINGVKFQDGIGLLKF